MLTVKELEALTPADHGRSLSDGGSLTGKVYAGGAGNVSVHFRWYYKSAGKMRTVRLGTWPAMTIADIRKARNQMRVQVEKGVDPIEASKSNRLAKQSQAEVAKLKAQADAAEAVQTQLARLAAQAAEQARMTVRQLFDRWHQLDLRNRVLKGADVKRSFEADVFPLIGDMAAEDVRKTHIQAILCVFQRSWTLVSV